MSTGIYKITIKGKEENLKFNNYSTEELKSYLFPNSAAVTREELNNAIKERWEENGLLLIKSLVYAGLCGYYYTIQDHCPYTKADIGEYVADASPEEIMPIFKVFFKAEGNEIIDDENSEEPVKKKTEENS